MNDTAFTPLVSENKTFRMPAGISKYLSNDTTPTPNNMASNNNLTSFQEVDTTSNNGNLAQELAKATASEDSGQTANDKDDQGADTTTISDERCKELFGSADLLDCMSALNAYVFKYTPEAQDKYGVDNDTHVGTMAQELEKNPATESTVEELPDGTKTVNTQELTMALTAAVAQMAKRIQELEEKV